MRKNIRVRRLLTVSAVFATGGIMLLPAPSVAQPPTHRASARIPQGSYQLVNLETGKCATVAGGVSAENNLGLVQFDCDMHGSRRWLLTDWNGDSYRLVNVRTGKCATVAGGVSTENNVGLVQFDCDTFPSRRWELTNWNGNSYQLVNVGTGKCATVAGGVSRANYVGLVQFTCDTHPSRRWSLQVAG